MRTGDSSFPPRLQQCHLCDAQPAGFTGYLRSSTWQSVTLAEELMGVLRAMLSLPQYLMTAMLVGAEHVTHRRESITGAIAKKGQSTEGLDPPGRLLQWHTRPACSHRCAQSGGTDSRAHMGQENTQQRSEATRSGCGSGQREYGYLFTGFCGYKRPRLANSACERPRGCRRKRKSHGWCCCRAGRNCQQSNFLWPPLP